jgi:hypothetical protein
MAACAPVTRGSKGASRRTPATAASARPAPGFRRGPARGAGGQSAAEDQVGRGPGVGVAQGPHREVLDRPGADPGDGEQGLPGAGRAAAGRGERDPPLRERAGGGLERRDALGGHADRVEVALRDGPGRREYERRLAVARAGDGPADAGGDAAHDRGGGLHGHLLADDRAGDQLERAPRAGDPQARQRLERRGEPGVGPERRVDRVEVGVEVEQRPDPAAERGGVPRGGAPHGHVQPRLLGVVGHGEQAGVAVDLDRAAVPAVVHALDARRGAGVQVADQVRPVQAVGVRERERDRMSSHTPSLRAPDRLGVHLTIRA